MGSALARAAAKGAAAPLLLSDHTAAKAQALARELGASAVDNGQVAAACDLIFLAVKPQAMAGLLSELEPVLKGRSGRFVLVTMAAGLSIAAIRQMAGADWPVIRIMPNTPASIGEGMILYCAEGTTEEEVTAFTGLMREAGSLDPLPEGLIDAGSAVSGCGPAFVYPFLEALADGAVACGLPRDKAQRYAAQTLVGAAKLVLESGSHPGALKDAVCSPGGSTIQGVRALERNGFRSAVLEAVIAAYQKTVDLGRQ